MRRLPLLAVVACLLVAGCGSAPSTPTTETRTVTPAPLPETPTDAPALTPDRAATLRPTCERGPRRVVEISATALRADNESAGIATLWAFTAPGTRTLYDSDAAFADATRRANGELMNATALSFGAFTRFGDGALQVVTATRPDGERVDFDVVVERQRGGRYDGCWMTTLVSRHRDRQAGPPRDG
jgi:hypothetical protein